MTDVGTLKELNVQPGDVVQCIGYNGYHIYDWWTIGKTYIVTEDGTPADDDGETYGKYHDPQPSILFAIISRASDKPKLWKDMTPEEKGALLLAAHEGKVIEWTGHFGYEFNMDSIRGKPVWSDTHAYRIRPEPKVDAVTLYGSPSKHIQWCLEQCALDTHRITFNLIDGKPDCYSVKMEPLE